MKSYLQLMIHQKKFNIINISINSSFILKLENQKILFLSDYDFFQKNN